MSDSNLSTLAYIPETTWGTTPNTPNLTKMRITGESLTHSKDTVQSEEIRDDRQISDLVEVGASAQGAVNFELQYEAFQTFLESALFNTIVAINETGTWDITGQILSGSSGDFDDVPVGASVKVAGSATPGNNGVGLVVAKAGNGSSITFAAGTMTGNTSGETIVVTGQHLPNGVVRKSFTIEREVKNSAGTEKYQNYTGMTADSLTLNFESKQIVKGTINFMGKIGADTAGSTIDTNGVYTAAPTGDMVNATTHVGTFLVDRVASSQKFKSLNLSIANNLRGQDAIGEAGNFDLGVGAIQVTGNFNAYFQDESLHEAFINHTDLAISFQTTDPAGNILVLTLPRLKLATGTPMISGKNTDVMTSHDFTAIRDATTGFTVCLDFHDA